MKALLVDDHGLFRHGLELILGTNIGFTNVLHACNLEEALSQQSVNPDLDLVLLDYNLGKDLGIDVLKRLKSIDPSLPVAMVSGRDDPHIVLSALGYGASGFIFKHMEPTELIQAITLILSGGMFVPSSVIEKSHRIFDDDNDDFYGRQVRYVAEVAKRIVREKNLNLCSQTELEDQMTLALNNLLEDLQDERDRLAVLAFKDELTGIANRRMFLDMLDKTLLAASTKKTNFALAYVDLDHFKDINDSMGHAIGDELLVEIARRLQAGVRQKDMIARLGGDEFTILFTQPTSEKDLSPLLTRLCASLREAITFKDGSRCKPSVSIGITLSKADDSAKTIMARADQALYKVKHAGRDNFAFVNEGQIAS